MKIIVSIPVNVTAYIERAHLEYDSTCALIRYLNITDEDDKKPYLERYENIAKEQFIKFSTIRDLIADKYVPENHTKYNFIIDYENNTITYEVFDEEK